VTYRTAGKELRLFLPPELYERMQAAADREYLPVTLYARRFLAINIDVMDPPESVTTATPSMTDANAN
jgi:hypothetical protein